MKMTCKNCENTIQGKYCSHCGQKASVGKITLASLLDEFSDSVFQVNRGFFYTLKELFWRPGKSINEYLSGKRKKHFKPIAYVLVFSTIYFLITEISGQNTWMEELIKGISAGVLGEERGTEIPSILMWFSRNYAYTTLLLLPVFSFASYLCFLRFGTNYLEHFVLNSYVTGQQAIVYSLFALLQTFVKSRSLELLPVLIAVSYALGVFWQFFDQGNRIVIVLRSVLTYILYLVLSLGILILIMGITGITD